MKDCCAIQLGAGLGGASTAHGYRRCAHAVNNERGTSLKLVGASEAEVRVNNCFLPTVRSYLLPGRIAATDSSPRSRCGSPLLLLITHFCADLVCKHRSLACYISPIGLTEFLALSIKHSLHVYSRVLQRSLAHGLIPSPSF